MQATEVHTVTMSTLPTIAIAGRPNVGKSTLFNRLTGRRTALVSDMPGLTRDRRAEEAEIGGHQMMVVDTAGLEESDPGTIAARMRTQSETAISESDIVLFVIDARAGVTPSDQAFARIIRASGKRVILVVNKCEGRAGESGFYEAYGLGLGEPVAISAEHGEGLGDLETEILNRLDMLEAPYSDGDENGDDADGGEAVDIDPAKPIRVAIVGRPNAGKSTLVNALIGEDRMITGPEPGLTRDSIATELEVSGRRIKLFDTAGLRRKARITELAEKLAASDAIRAINFAEVVVLLIDAEHPLEHQDLTIAGFVADEGRALVVAVNKWDLVQDKQKVQREIRELVTEKMDAVVGVPLVMISAIAERGLDKLWDAVFSAHAAWNKRLSTSELNRWLEEALARHSPPAASGRRIKLRYITQPSARPPTFVTFCSKPEDLPRSYVRYLTNSLREAFDLNGVPIRFNLRKSANPFEKRRKRGSVS